MGFLVVSLVFKGCVREIQCFMGRPKGPDRIPRIRIFQKVIEHFQEVQGDSRCFQGRFRGSSGVSWMFRGGSGAFQGSFFRSQAIQGSLQLKVPWNAHETFPDFIFLKPPKTLINLNGSSKIPSNPLDISESPGNLQAK